MKKWEIVSAQFTYGSDKVRVEIYLSDYRCWYLGGNIISYLFINIIYNSKFAFSE